MKLVFKRVEESEAHIEHLQERVDTLRDNLRDLEDFVTKKLCSHIDDRFKELEDYLNIERVVDNTHYRSKEKNGKVS